MREAAWTVTHPARPDASPPDRRPRCPPMEVAVARAAAMDVRARSSVAGGWLRRPDALLVTSLTNIRYLTGFTGSAGLLFVLPDEVACS